MRRPSSEQGQVYLLGNYTVSWTGSPGATSYRLLEGTLPYQAAPIVHTVTAASRAFQNRPNGLYYYRVEACNAVGCSAASTEASIKVAVRPPPVTGLVVTPPVTTEGEKRSQVHIRPFESRTRAVRMLGAVGRSEACAR